MTTSRYLSRRRLHNAQCLSNAKMSKDKAHVVMLDTGPYRHLFGLLVDMDASNPVTNDVHRGETKLFLLLDGNLNPQPKSMRGIANSMLFSWATKDTPLCYQEGQAPL